MKGDWGLKQGALLILFQGEIPQGAAVSFSQKCLISKKSLFTIHVCNTVLSMSIFKPFYCFCCSFVYNVCLDHILDSGNL